jgi:PLP dependent protein
LVDHIAIAERIAQVQGRIRSLANGREVMLIAVTKGFTVDAIAAAVEAGCRDIGESYAQELCEKLHQTPDSIDGLHVHFIGQLQRNKVRKVAPLISTWHSVDRSSLAAEIARQAPQAQVFVQVDATAEPGKGGCPPGQVGSLVEHCQSNNLQVQGLMAVGPTSGDPAATRQAFRLVRTLADQLGLKGCSMGMSEDLQIAIEEGSTHVRIGSAIFGERPPRT